MKDLAKGWYILLFLLTGTSGFAQSTKLPEVIPPSPSAQQFHKYGDYPVSYFTGVPEIGVPLYEIKTGDLALPLQIRYHASGFKPTDRDGLLGLSWTLNFGGQISRQIHGIADDHAQGLLLSNPRHTTNSLYYTERHAAFDYLRSVTQHGTDSEYDVFSYSAGANSGSFVLKREATGSYSFVAKPLFLNYKKYEKLTCQLNPTTNRIEAFDFVNENGERYRFGKSVADGTLAYERTGTHGEAYASNNITSWLLTEIISADCSDTIKFLYNDLKYLEYYNYVFPYSVQTDYLYQWNIGSPFVNPHYIGSSAQNTPNFYHTRTIKEIQFKNGSLKFNYTADGLFLSSVDIHNDNRKIKTITFYTSRYGLTSAQDDNHHKLDSLSIGGQEVYKFDYVFNPLTSYRPLSEDWWGYYNGGYFPSSMTPSMLYPYGGYLIGDGNVNRNPSEDAKNLMLQTITYPTGGSTTFVYELNQYKAAADQQIRNAGGLRIHRIVSGDGVGGSNVKSYKYGTNEDGTGEVIFEPTIANLLSHGSVEHWGNNTQNYNDFYAYKSASIATHLPQLTSYSAPVYYKEVTQYQGDISSNSGKEVFRFYDMPGISKIPTQNVSYDYYSLWGPYQFGVENAIPAQEDGIFSTDRFGLLKERLIYKNERNNFILIQKDCNDYCITINEQLLGLKVREYGTYFSLTVADPARNLVDANQINRPTILRSMYVVPPPPFIYRNYYIYSTAVTLQSQTTTEYNQAGAINNTVRYGYSNGFPTWISKTSSDGKSEDLSYYRAQDKDFLSLTPEASAAVDNMIDQNLVAPVLQEVQTIADRDEIGDYRILAQTIKTTNYKIWDAQGKIVKPKEAITDSYILDGGLGNNTTRINFYGYDEGGNLTEVSKENDVKTSYLWGFKKAYPVAQVINADFKDVFYTSFEEDGNSNDGDSKSGRKSRVGGYTKSLSGLTNGDYMLSYWQKSGSAWSLQSVNISVAIGSYTINLTGQVDEVRFYPAKAQMVTYTYEPLIGITSQLDANNRSVNYEYDAIGRLTRIRDEDKNILKQYQYQYNGQYQGLAVYYNYAQSSSILPQCGSGYNTEPVTYTVPAGMYTSAISQANADQKAINDIATNGQDYANRHGVCAPAYANTYVSQNFTKQCEDGGLVGSVVTYSVPAGTYRATTQQAADQMALDDLAANGQSYANKHGECAPQIYVRLDMELASESMFWDGSCGTWGSVVYYNAVLRFFSDAACTQPLNVTNLSVNIMEETFDQYDNYDYTHSFQTVSGTSAVVRSNIEIYYDCDEYRGGWCYLQDGNYIRVN